MTETLTVTLYLSQATPAGVDLALDLAPRASAAHFWDTAVLRMNTAMQLLQQLTRESEDVSRSMVFAKTCQLDVVLPIQTNQPVTLEHAAQR
jgi:hypothetical protein